MADQSDSLSTPCRPLEQDLILFHYGDLSGIELDTLQSHIKGCTGCTGYLAELAKLLPLTVKADEPPQTFWTDYNRELRRKLDDAAAKQSWWQSLASFFQPRWLPALATAAVVVLVLTFTLGKGFWPTKSNPQEEDNALIEALPVAENLEFFKAMDVLDDLDLLEFMGSQGNNNA
jgi:hypothetical protein